MKIKPQGLASCLLAVIVTIALSISWTAAAASFETIAYPSEDGLKITADLYGAQLKPGAPLIVAFHQAGSSRGEYRTIAPKLLAMGYRVLAPDQRSGRAYDGVSNETAARAKAAGKPTRYRNAMQDLVASIAYAKKLDPQAKIILWGSSYSASLVLKLAARPGLAAAVLSFSPGEYFGGSWVADTAGRIKIPTFITSARGEAYRWKGIFNNIGTRQKTGFIPPVAGRHGSSALHPSQGAEAIPYWRAVKAFLRNYARRD